MATSAAIDKSSSVPTALHYKNEIFALLVNINDVDELLEIKEFLQDFLDSENGYGLSPQQEIELEEAIVESYDESKLIANDEVKKMSREWLKR